MLVVARSLCANYKPTVVTCGKSNEAVSPSTFPRGAGEGNIYFTYTNSIVEILTQSSYTLLD